MSHIALELSCPAGDGVGVLNWLSIKTLERRYHTLAALFRILHEALSRCRNFTDRCLTKFGVIWWRDDEDGAGRGESGAPAGDCGASAVRGIFSSSDIDSLSI